MKEKDDQGESFYFVVNGEPMFAKGANFIPDDALLPNITEERYRQLFKDVKDANMNMIRVWGGGIYEDDVFTRRRMRMEFSLAGFYFCLHYLSVRSCFYETGRGRGGI